MYCHCCGREILFDSKFCPNCGVKLIEDTILEEQKSNKLWADNHQEANNSEDVQRHLRNLGGIIPRREYWLRRLVGTIIDKIVICFFSLIVIYFIGAINYNFFGIIGTFSALFHMTTDSVYSSAIGHVMQNYEGDFMSQHIQEIDSRFKELIGIELIITYLFIIINIIYYVITESLLGSSFGKYLCKLKIANSTDIYYEKITIGKVFLRAFVFFLLISMFIGLRWIIGFNYCVLIVLFFFIMDLTVFFRNQSLLDIFTKTKLLYKPERTSLSTMSGLQIEKDKSKKGKGQNESCEFHPKRKMKMAVCFFYLILSLYSTHCILTYFFADYYNPSNYDGIDYQYNDKESDNYWIKRGSLFPQEKLLCKNRMMFISKKNKDDSIDEFNAFGIYVSTYDGEFEKEYYAGSRKEKIGGYRGQYYEVPIYHRYKYKNSISTYEISNKISIKDDDTDYDAYLANIGRTLGIDANKSACYKTINGKKVLEYYKKSNTKRLITCTNKRIYIIETVSPKEVDLNSLEFFNQFDFNFPTTFDVLILYFILPALLFIVILGLYIHKRNKVINRYAYSLFVVGIISFIVNMVIALCQAYGLYTDLDADNFSVIALAGSLLSASCVSTPLCVFYMRKSKLKWEKDYIVPSLLKRMQYEKIQSNLNKSSYVLYICYPLMILSLLPFGIFIVLLYSIPVILIIAVAISFNKWHQWVKGSKTS